MEKNQVYFFANSTEVFPDYPITVTVSHSSEDTEKYKDTVGSYNIVSGESYNGRPVWKHLTSNLFLYYLGKGHYDTFALFYIIF